MIKPKDVSEKNYAMVIKDVLELKDANTTKDTSENATEIQLLKQPRCN